MGGEETLRRIAPEAVAAGMFVHAFEGGWLSHPFWRARFVVRPDQVARIRDSGVDAVVIDTARGRPATAADAPEAAAAPPPAGPAPPFPHAPDGAEAERRAMRQLLGRSGRTIQAALDGLRAGRPLDAAAGLAVVDGITGALRRNPAMLLGLTRLKTADTYTYLHSLSVCALMVMLARELDLPDEEVRAIGLGGLFHDVGKMAVDPAILRKPGPLDGRELAEMRLHPVRGHAMLAATADVPPAALAACLGHHEKLDGSGYPHGLRGAAVGPVARIAAICDMYDAMTSQRAYKAAWTPLAAVTELAGLADQLDARLLFRFMRGLGVFPVGMLVRLRSNRLAIVHGADAKGTRSRLRAFYAIPERAPVPPMEVRLDDTSAGDQVVARERPEAWGLPDWEGMKARLLA